MSDLEIRPLEPDDARAAVVLTAHPEVARALGGTPFDSPHVLEQRFRAGFGPAGSDRLGAFAGGALVGLVEVARGGRPRVAHAARVTLAVHPSRRGRGVGAALLDAALEAADRWMHLVRLDVEILADDAVARGLFERRGFEVEVRRTGALVVDGALATTLALGRIRPGFVQPEGALRPMPAPPPRRPPPASIVMRPITPDDATSTSAFSRDPTILFASSQVPTMGIDYWRRRIEGSAAGTWGMVVLVDGVIAACGNVHSFDSPRRRHALELGMSVLGPYQGMGIGDRLMAALLETAFGWLGAERVELMVLADNTRAVRLYEKYGFTREGVLRYDIWRDGGYADSLVMSLLRPRGG